MLGVVAEADRGVVAEADRGVVAEADRGVVAEAVGGLRDTTLGDTQDHHASTPSPPQNLADMADDTDAGLPVRQLLKMVASGDLSPAEFKKLTRLRRRETLPHGGGARRRRVEPHSASCTLRFAGAERTDLSKIVGARR
jgi:hypothetical protein